MAPTYSSLVIITGAVGAAGVEHSFLAGKTKDNIDVLDGKNDAIKHLLGPCAPEEKCWARPSQVIQGGKTVQVNGIAGCVIPKDALGECCGLGGKKSTGHNGKPTNAQLSFISCEGDTSSACVEVNTIWAKKGEMHQKCK